MVRFRRECQNRPARPTTEQKHDLFSQLVDARDSDEMLTEDELVGESVLLYTWYLIS